MKMKLYSLLAVAALILPVFAEEETRTIRLIQDDAQDRMVTKIYDLKNLKASDIGMYVDASVRRYNATSTVRCLNFSLAKRQALIVTTAIEFMPYVDQIIATLDRGTKKDKFGSAIVNAGYTWQVYWPRFRWGEELQTAADMMLSNNGRSYYANGALWIKDDPDDVQYALDWVKYFDRPVPQASVTFRYYSVRESTLRDVGIDYLAWKNGPGMNLVDFAFSSGRIAWDKVFNTAATLASSATWAYGGFFTAPAFDMSFVRLLQQSGEAKLVASATVNIVNNQSEEALIALSPTLNSQVKDPDNHAASVVALEHAADMLVSVSKFPSICFFTEDKEVNEYGWIPATKEFYAKNQGSLVFSYRIETNDSVESNNYGTQIGKNTISSTNWKTINFGREQVLVNAVREYDVEQTTGVPFLCQLPVLKYIFGTTTTSKEKSYVFITVEANLVYPETIAAK